MERIRSAQLPGFIGPIEQTGDTPESRSDREQLVRRSPQWDGVRCSGKPEHQSPQSITRYPIRSPLRVPISAS